MNTTTLRFLLLGTSAFLLLSIGADEIGAESESRVTYEIPDEYISTDNRMLVAEAHTNDNRQIEMYIPPAPMRPTPLIRVATGGTRSSYNGFPIVTLLVPEHVALTTKEQPTLYWHISQATQKPVVFTLIEHDAVKPLLEEPFRNPVSRGIHAVKLADYGIRLEANKIYEWSVSIIDDPSDPSGDAIARSFIQILSPNAEIIAIQQQSEPLSRAQGFARLGVWHDALAAALEEVSNIQARDKHRRTFNLLLKQVELNQVVSSISGDKIVQGRNL